jgi:hypothetical protein
METRHVWSRWAGSVAVMAALLGAAATPSAAQVVFRTGGGDDPSALLDVAPAAFGVAAWTAGEWARYNLSQSFGGTGQSITRFRTVGVLGQQEDRYWVEVQEEVTGLARMQVPTRKLLLPFGPVTERAMSEMLTLMSDSSIRRTTVVRAPLVASAAAPFPQGWQAAGEESVTTAAGTFTARHYKKDGEDIWVAASAGPLGIVRYRGGGGGGRPRQHGAPRPPARGPRRGGAPPPAWQIELVARGASGAKTRFPAGSSQ